MRRSLLFVVFLFSMFPVEAQSPWEVSEIEIRGNDYTVDRVILREVAVNAGDTIHNWSLFKTKTRDLLLNTGLFTSVEISREVDRKLLKVTVEEALFLLPIPFVEFADRNFNEWWVTHDHDLRRLNFGLNLYHTNLTGRNDLFKLTGQFGFIKKVNLAYHFPHIDRNLDYQPYIDLLYATQNEVPYTTSGNKQQWHSNENEAQLTRYKLTGGINFRPEYRTTYTMEASYFHRKAGSEILQMNPFFFGDSLTVQKFAQLRIAYNADYRNRLVYPTDGYKFKVAAIGNGLSQHLNTLHLEGEFAWWKPLNTITSLGMNIYLRKYLYAEQLPFYNAKALGYNDRFVRSYEYFVVDGPDYILAQSDVKWQLMDMNIDWGKIVFIKALRNMPVQIFANLFADAGRVKPWHNSENNFLDQQWLVGYGTGIDVLLYENFLFQLQYSRGIHGNDGIFLHFSTNY